MSKSHEVGEMVQLLGLLAPYGQPKLSLQLEGKRVAGKQAGKDRRIAFQTATKNVGGFRELPSAGVLLAVLQGSLKIPGALVVYEIGQGTRRYHRGQCERPGNASGQSAGLPLSPLAPPFGQAPIGDSAEWQIIQVSPQVIRQ